MTPRRTLIFLSTIALALNMTAVVHADQSASQSLNSSSDHFNYVGFRSHGLPIQSSGDIGNWLSSQLDNLQSDGSPTANPADGDQGWLQTLLAQLSNYAPKGYYAPAGSPANTPISCHGSCQTLTGTVALIPVWVGNWASGDVTNWNSVLGNIVTSLGSASANSIAVPGHVFNTNTLYFTSQGLTPPSLQWVTNTSVTAPTATTVSDADVATYINSFISANPTIVPTGATPVYIYIGANSTLLTSGFGTTYCGWHSYGSVSSGGQNVPFIALQDFTSSYNKPCAPQVISPNGSPSLDAMASVMVHEVDETLTDPYFGAWFDSKGAESADKCGRTYGVSHSVALGKSNVQLGGVNYLIQQNWLENNIVTSTGTSTATACSVTG